MGVATGGCAQILGLADPVGGPDASVGADALPGADAAILPDSDSDGDDSQVDLPEAAGGCVSGAPCAAGGCQRGMTVCDGDASSCVAKGPLPGCEGQSVCDDAGACTCKVTCGSTCVDETSDPANCGACGHACVLGDFSSACAAKACRAMPIQSVLDGNYRVSGIAITGTTIIFSELYLGVVSSISLHKDTFQYSGNANLPGLLRTDAQNVYWAELGVPTDAGRLAPSSGAIMRAPIGQATQTALASAQTYPAGLAVDATYVYWTAHAPSGQIMKCAITGCANSPTALATGQSNPTGIAVDGTNVYWVNSGTGSDGQVMKCAVAGCGNAPTPVATGLLYPAEIVVQGSALYWTNSGTSQVKTAAVHDGTIMTCPVSGCGAAPTILASKQLNPRGIAADGADVYWANFGNGSQFQGDQGLEGQVLKCSLNGCNDAPSVLQDVTGPTEIAIGSDFVTWGDWLGGIWALPK